MQDVDSEKWRQYAEARPGLAGLIWSREARCLFELERRAALSFDASVFVSAPEAQLFQRLAPESAHRVHAVSNGVDLDFFKTDTEFRNPFGAEPAIVFIGVMNYWPNVDAVAWFSREVMPQLRRLQPSPVFWIVGADPTPMVRHLASDPKIRVTGRVQDIRPYLQHASVVVAPLRIARGIQNKVIEAMAMSAPVVVSPQAAEGLDVEIGADLLVARSAEEFAQKVARVIDGRGLGIGDRARARVERHYAWGLQFAKLDRIIDGDAL